MAISYLAMFSGEIKNYLLLIFYFDFTLANNLYFYRLDKTILFREN